MRAPPELARPSCARCLRPTSVCVCALLPTLAPATRVVILQHPREHRMPIGTARMAARCLEGAALLVGTRLDAHPTLAAALNDPTRTPVLLWPGSDARDLASAPPVGPLTLLVLDGTWKTAKALLNMNPRVAALPRFALAPATPSEYRIRREPRAECLSTIEAVAQALGVLEGQPERYRAMLAPFRAMVDAQIAHMSANRTPRDKSRLALKRHRGWRPPAVLADLARVVLVAAESNAWPAQVKHLYEDEIVHWLALRGDGSQRAEVIVRPTHPPAPGVALHTELEPEELLQGRPRADLERALHEVVRPGDLLATWGTYAPRLLHAAGLARGHRWIDLRRIAADWQHAAPGSIERFAATLPHASPPAGRGRGGRRLGQLLAVLQTLSVSGTSPASVHVRKA